MSAVNGAVVNTKEMEYDLNNINNTNTKRYDVNKDNNTRHPSSRCNTASMEKVNSDKKWRVNENNINNTKNKTEHSQPSALPWVLPEAHEQWNSEHPEEWEEEYYQGDFTDSSEDYLFSSLGASLGIDTVKRYNSNNNYGSSNNSNNNTINNKKTNLTRTLLPNFVSTHGRTVYGGNPIVQQTLPGYFAYPSPFVLIPIVFIIMIPFLVVGTCLVIMSHRFYQVAIEYNHINNYQYEPIQVMTSHDTNYNSMSRIREAGNGISYMEEAFTNNWSQGIHMVAHRIPNNNDNNEYGIRHFIVDGVDYPQGKRAWVNFTLRKRMRAPVLFEYSIHHLHQNFREFHRGRSINQLRGKSKIGKISDCKPYDNPGYVLNTQVHAASNNKISERYLWVNYTDGNTDNDENVISKRVDEFTYNPCGMAAYAMFNDTFTLYKAVTPRLGNNSMDNNDNNNSSNNNSNSVSEIDFNSSLLLICNGSDFDAQGNPRYNSVSNNLCTKRKISWRADRTVRFAPLRLRPDWWSRNYPFNTSNPFLNNGWYLGEAGHALPDPQDEDFQVWMKSAVLASFKKLYRVINVDLLPGTYVVEVEEFYDTVSFNGKKGFVIASESWVGSNSVGMGIVFLVIGGLCFVLGVSFSLEFILQRHGFNRYAHLPLPKRDWYYFEPNSASFAKYYQLRLERHLLVAKLRTLQKLQNMDNNDSSLSISSSSLS